MKVMQIPMNNLSVYLSVNRSLCLSLSLPFLLSLTLSLSLSIYLSISFKPRLSYTKDSKMAFDAFLLNTQHYKVRIKG